MNVDDDQEPSTAGQETPSVSAENDQENPRAEDEAVKPEDKPSMLQTPPPEEPPGDEVVKRSTTIKFVAQGDVILALTSPNGEARFQVSSTILCLGSPVFRAMLGVESKFREAVDLSKRDTAREPFELSLKDDDPNAMAVILRILHFKHNWIPKTLTPERFYEIAIICDKYDLGQALENWLTRWTPESFTGTITPDQWLFIAYVLGKTAEFKSLSQELILRCTSDSDGNLKVASLTEAENPEYVDIITFMPDPVLTEIKKIRQQTILAMIDAINSEIEQYSHPDQKINCKHSVATCDTVILGVLMTGFKRLNAYPDASGIMNQTIQDIKKHLSSVQFPDMLVLQKSTTGGCCGNPAQNTACLEAGHTQCDDCPKCASCKNHYKPVTEVDHVSCSPLPGLMQKLDGLVNGVVGLEYCQFISKETQKSAPDLSDDDLWYSLWFDPSLGPYV